MAQTKSTVRLHTTIDLGPIINLSSPHGVGEPAATFDSDFGRTRPGAELASWSDPRGLPVSQNNRMEMRR